MPRFLDHQTFVKTKPNEIEDSLPFVVSKAPIILIQFLRNGIRFVNEFVFFYLRLAALRTERECSERLRHSLFGFCMFPSRPCHLVYVQKRVINSDIPPARLEKKIII